MLLCYCFSIQASCTCFLLQILCSCFLVYFFLVVWLLCFSSFVPASPFLLSSMLLWLLSFWFLRWLLCPSVLFMLVRLLCSGFSTLLPVPDSSFFLLLGLIYIPTSLFLLLFSSFSVLFSIFLFCSYFKVLASYIMLLGLVSFSRFLFV